MSVERILHSQDYNEGVKPTANCFWAMVLGVTGWWEDDKTYIQRVKDSEV